MKIGLALDDTLDTPDGVQQYVLAVGRWLSGAGHDVRYLVGHTARTDIPGLHSLSRNMQVKFNGNRMSMPLPANRNRLRNFLQTEQFDVIHVQMPYSPFLAGRLLSVMPETTAVVGTFHILPYSRLVTAANYGLRLLNRRSARRFDGMLAVSAPAAEFARKVYGYDCTVLPNPINLAQFAGAHSTDNNLSIIFLGRLVERKGPLQLLMAIEYLVRNRLFDKPFRVIIGGKGALLTTLERYVTEHNLTETVRFAGFIPEDDKADFLASGDVVVYPSTGGESFGIVLLEAMAASRGVVLAGNNPGYSSVMEPFPGQLFDPHDTAAFADKVAAYLQDAEARHLAAAAQKQYVKAFDVAVVGRKLLKHYEAALHKRSQA